MIGLYILGALALVSLGLSLWQVLVAMRFPLHRRSLEGDHFPAVTILKPLKGGDGKTAQCLRSWLAQRYRGKLQVLFGVASPNDPVCPEVRRLLEEFPSVDAQLVICPERLAVNAKVSTLVQLERVARHEVVVVSDADVFAPPELITELVMPFKDPAVGLVNCFYSMPESGNLAMRLEAVAINADFWSQVLQSQELAPLDYAMGAVMATTGKWLDKIGGFESLGNYLADDYQLGNRIARQGGKVVLSPMVVACSTAAMEWKEVWNHQLRWARTIRVCKPWPYAASIVSNGTFWPLLWLAAYPVKPVAITAIACLVLRYLVVIALERRLTRRRLDLVGGALAWIKDLLQVWLWAHSFIGDRVEWRGHRYHLLRGGKLRQIN